MNRYRKIMAPAMAFLLMLTLFLPMSHTQAASIGESLINYGKKFMGVRYVFGGTTPSGFDCSGFTQYVYKNQGISIPRTTGQQYNIGTSVSKSQLQIGDLVFFANTYKPGISHVGIYAGDNMVLNATTSKGIALVSLSNSYWGPKYAGAKRILDGKFKDVSSSHLAFDAIEDLTDKKIINGYSDYTFKPNEPVTRGQAAAFLNRELNLEAMNLSQFTDVDPSNPFAKDIAAIREAGIINGFADQTYRPYSYITRTEMAAILKKAYELNLGNATAAGNSYSDVRSDSWAYEAITAMKLIDQTGVFNTANYNGPSRATRATFSAALYNSMNAR
ncbi:C40 family peptidase [Bacillus sp. FJAT-42315]|uniref:C40 family peptidase n=1 Tax=Bacillus sp. FJAT-42315 TaxID=2014077 RepID=UPI000C237F8A|nr:C40 family peptidase [Bacillus sp. FJAT-42315]